MSKASNLIVVLNGRLVLKSKHSTFSKEFRVLGPDFDSISFNLGQQSQGSSMCVGALAAQDPSIMGNNVWLLGDKYAHARGCSLMSIRLIGII